MFVACLFGFATSIHITHLFLSSYKILSSFYNVEKTKVSLFLFPSNGCTNFKAPSLFPSCLFSPSPNTASEKEETEEKRKSQKLSGKKDSSGASTRKELPLLFHFETYYLFLLLSTQKIPSPLRLSPLVTIFLLALLLLLLSTVFLLE